MLGMTQLAIEYWKEYYCRETEIYFTTGSAVFGLYENPDGSGFVGTW